MADRTVTLTGTTVGTSITTVDIYHTTVGAVNLVVSGVTREDLIAGYSFVDDDTHNIYIIVADSPCSTQDTVTFSVSPTPTATVTQTATPSTTPTNTPTITQTVTSSVTPNNNADTKYYSVIYVYRCNYNTNSNNNADTKYYSVIYVYRCNYNTNTNN